MTQGQQAIPKSWHTFMPQNGRHGYINYLNFGVTHMQTVK